MDLILGTIHFSSSDTTVPLSFSMSLTSSLIPLLIEVKLLRKLILAPAIPTAYTGASLEYFYTMDYV
jgi:hypothetical protein